MKKSILTLALIFTATTIIFSQQRMRLPKGSFKLSKSTTKIPANCIDRAADTPEIGNVFEIATNSIVLVGNSVPQIGLQEAVQKGIIEVTGNGTSTGININLLKPELGYDEIVVKNSSGVLGFKGQNFEDLNKLKDLEPKMKIVDEKNSEYLKKYDEDHPVSQFFESGKYRIDGMFTDEYSVEEIKTEIDKLIKTTQLYEKNYNFYSSHEELKNFQSYLFSKYPEENVIIHDFKKVQSEIEYSLKQNNENEVAIEIDNLIKDIKGKDKAYDLINPDDYAFLRRYTWDYNILNNKNIIVENPNDLSTKDIRNILKHNENPFILSKDAFFENLNKPKEKLKFIIVGSEDAAVNKELYEALSEDQMKSFTNYVKDIKSNEELAPYFEFVSSKESLEQSLKNNEQFRTITLYHNREDDLLFGELKSSYSIQDRLTCNSFEERYWSNPIESIDFIDPEDVINSFANLIENNPNKNEFQIIDFYKKFSKDYKSIRLERSKGNKLLVGNAIIIITGTGTMILWIPTGEISGKVLSEDSVGIDSIEVNLLDPNERVVASTKTSNGEFLFEDIMASEYYLSIGDYVNIIDAKDNTPEDSMDAELLYGEYIYVNLEPKESDQDNNFKINKN